MTLFGRSRESGYTNLLGTHQKEKAASACGFQSLICVNLSRLLAVLILRDTMADAVLLAIDTALLCLCQVTVVLRHVSLFTVLDGGLALFEMGRLLRS